jgi:GH25 family lysozyme M1 (1,4-beta-N-acetylmuramidase)
VYRGITDKDADQAAGRIARTYYLKATYGAHHIASKFSENAMLSIG